MLVTVHDRGPEAADIHLVPQLWFRNSWSWRDKAIRPEISVAADGGVSARLKRLGEYRPYAEGEPESLVTGGSSGIGRAVAIELGGMAPPW
jgi:hypothetical protein